MKYALILIIMLAAGGWVLLRAPQPTAAPVPTADDIARAEALRPANTALAAIYERSCFTCHASPDAQAPMTGHVAAWEIRAKARGADGLLASAQTGFGAMPAMGLCPDCTEAEFRALIGFMSGGAGA